MLIVLMRGWMHLRHSIPAWRAAAFLGGLFAIWIAAGSRLAMLDEELLTVHMVQHLLLMTVGAPLILLGAPVLPLPRLPLVQRVGSVLANPIFCWFTATAILIGWHVPSAFALGLGSELWHRVEQASFLAAGLLFWWPVILTRPRWGMVLYLFLATLPCDALSAFLAFCDRVVYPAYLATPRHFDISPLQDQECAGALMWVWVTFAYLVPAVVITTRLLSRDIYCQLSEGDSSRR
jgi:cytochrome c oxidase assembly factor CtaG